MYSADGRLWKLSATGGGPREIPFSAKLSIQRPAKSLPPARFPEPGRETKAHGFMGLAISPDGTRIGMLALGRLWIIPVGSAAREVTRVPFEAASLSWSPDGSEVAWAAGAADEEDVFATNLTTGQTRRVTALTGRETFPVYSPDGRYLAFVHSAPDPRLRIVDAHASPVSDAGESRDLGPVALNAASPPQWSPASDGLVVTADPASNPESRATFVSISGSGRALDRFPDAPIFLQWTARDSIVFVRHDRLWQAPSDRSGLLLADAQPVSAAAALYASASRDGAVLFVSDDGLRVRSADGIEQKVGWPISYTPPIAESIVIRNVRIIDGTGGPVTDPRDIQVERGRIARIAPAGTLQSARARLIDAAGRVAIPGLIDLHAHTYRPDLLPGFVHFGITTVRDQGSSMAPLVAYADAIAAGAVPGPRVAYGGFQFYSDWAFDDEQGRGIEPEADAGHVERAVALAEAFGAQHVKTRTFRRWDIDARIIAEAHRRGLRTTGHCAHQLPLIAAGIDAKEHIGLCEPRGNGYIYADVVQLYKAADIPVVPTIVYLDFAARLNERPELLDEDAEVAPFLPARENFGWMLKLSAAERQRWAADARRARETTAKLAHGGVTIGTGTDVWQSPVGLHMELAELVAAGLSPLQALHAATGAAARILGAETDFGTIEVGRRADLVLLDADPLADIRNTRRIWRVVQDGRVVDRGAIAAAANREKGRTGPTGRAGERR
jgi:imidazolonepropionase-like amidohydrolase